MPSKKTGASSSGPNSGNSANPSKKVSGTGMGSEAAEGIHAVGGRDQSSPSSSASRETGRSKTAGGTDRAGSEPLGRQQQTHKGSYGGEGGEPRSSSDQRQAGGGNAVGAEKAGGRSVSKLGDEEAGDGLGTEASEGGGEGKSSSKSRK
jgi:hypothetical protein